MDSESNIDGVVDALFSSLETANTIEDVVDTIVTDDAQLASIKSLLDVIDSFELNSDNLQDFAIKLEDLTEKVKNNEIVSLDDLTASVAECEIDPTLDDSTFEDTPPNGGKNIPFFTIGETVSDIEAAYNYARSFDPTVNGKKLELPSQAVWDSLSQEERALYILNRERVDRGLKPFEGVVAMNQALTELKPTDPQTLADVAQAYTNLLYTETSLSHTLDGTPTERIERVDYIRDNKEFIPYNESLYAEGNSFKLSSIPIEKAIYVWIYADEVVAEGEAWGHRAMCLMKIDNDDFGVKGAEGIIAFGLKQGNDSQLYQDFYTSIVTLNAINPTSGFPGEYKKSVLCYGTNSEDDRFVRENGLITDTETGLVWQDIQQTQKNLDEAQEYCETLELAGFDDWRLPKVSELSEFYKSALSVGVTPNLSQINISLMSADGGLYLQRRCQ